ncbi:ATP-grasp domain-containing protein [Sorangium sp. So ce260]|uniref:ATP-grasp domain-containing protein n=1 Tax=Sorangium sp. So ce260 TaxID=3133291 RepID=UPI003F5EF3C4
MTLVLFPHQTFTPREVEPDFAEEHAAAREEGLATALIDHTEITRGDSVGAVRRVPAVPATGVYRGWMLRAADYHAFYTALAERGVSLVNDPDAYRFCHHLPECYPALAGETPLTTWLPVPGEVDFEAAPPTMPPVDWMREIARRVPSRLFTMAVALREDGRWTVIELGDGQVAGLPAPELARDFHRQLRKATP